MIKIKKVDFEPGRGTCMKLVLDGDSVTGFLASYREASGKPNSDDAWYQFFALNTAFFESLEKPDAEVLFAFYKLALTEALRAVDEVSTTEVIKRIGAALASVDKSIKLTAKIAVYENTLFEDGIIQYPNLEQVGTRAHDRDDMTFRLPDYRILTQASIISKLMIPVWGTLIRTLRSWQNRQKVEMYIIHIFNVILYNNHFKATTIKLDKYIENTLATHRSSKSKMVSPEDAMIARLGQGFLEDTEFDYVRAIMFLKKLCIFDAKHSNTEKHGDLVSYLHTAIGTTYDALVSDFYRNNQLKVRYAPTNDDSVDQFSDLERSGTPVDATADSATLVKFRTRHSLDNDPLFKTIQYPAAHMRTLSKNLRISRFHQFLMTIVCQDIILTGTSFKQIDHTLFLDVLLLSRARLVHDGYHRLASLIMCRANENMDNVPAAQSAITLSYMDYAAYQRIISLLPHQIGNTSIATTIARIVHHLSRGGFVSMERGAPDEYVVVNREVLEELYDLLLRRLDGGKS